MVSHGLHQPGALDPANELQVTENITPDTEPRLSALAQADYIVYVTPQPGFPISLAMVNHFHQIHRHLQPPPMGKSQRFASFPHTKETFYSPNVRSSRNFPFRESPIVDRFRGYFTLNIRGSTTQVEYRTTLPPGPGNHVPSTSLHHVLLGLVGSSPESFNSWPDRPLWCRHGICRICPAPTAVYLALHNQSQLLGQMGPPWIRHGIQYLVASA